MSDDLREALAAYAHDAWSRWMRYQFYRSRRVGSAMVIPRHLVQRWRRQMSTPYSDLPEGERESDRREADHILRIIGR